MTFAIVVEKWNIRLNEFIHHMTLDYISLNFVYRLKTVLFDIIVAFHYDVGLIFTFLFFLLFSSFASL